MSNTLATHALTRRTVLWLWVDAIGTYARVDTLESDGQFTRAQHHAYVQRYVDVMTRNGHAEVDIALSSHEDDGPMHSVRDYLV